MIFYGRKDYIVRIIGIVSILLDTNRHSSGYTFLKTSPPKSISVPQN